MAYHKGDVLNELADDITTICEDKGFWDDFQDGSTKEVPVKLALIHDEISEALKVHREVYDDSAEDSISGMTSMQEDDFTEELADAIIRILDLAGFMDLDIGGALLAKVEKNKERPRKHGKRY